MTEQHKDRPILFSGEMVKAILAEKKTVTRRVIKPQPPKIGEYKFSNPPYKARFNHVSQQCKSWWLVPLDVSEYDPTPYEMYEYDCPYGKVGDRLWLRETFKVYPTPGCTFGELMMGRKHTIEYRADNATEDLSGGSASTNGFHADYGSAADDYNVDYYGVWRPSIFMPRWASRITLEVTNVSAERVQDISEADAIKEGIDWSSCNHAYAQTIGTFATLWDKINAERGYSWDSNPYVWRVEFKRVDTEAIND